MEFHKTKGGNVQIKIGGKTCEHYLIEQQGRYYLPLFFNAQGDEAIIGGSPVELEEAKRLTMQHRSQNR